MRECGHYTICVDVQAIRPTTLLAIVGLTKLYESRNYAQKRVILSPNPKPYILS